MPFTDRRPFRLAHAAALLAAALWAMAAQAESIYTCKDETGRVLTSDRPIAECARRPMRELTATGVLKNELPPPLTHEQLKQKQIEDERQRIADLIKAQENARNRALLIAYPNLASLEIARKRHIEDMNNEAAIIERRMAKEHREMLELQQQVKAVGSAKAPYALKKQVEQIAMSILADNDVLQRVRQDQAQLNQRFDDDARRLKQLLRDPDEAPPSRAAMAAAMANAPTGAPGSPAAGKPAPARAARPGVDPAIASR